MAQAPSSLKHSSTLRQTIMSAMSQQLRSDLGVAGTSSNHHARSDESVKSDDGELYRLEIRNGKKVLTKSRPDPSNGKGGGKGKTDRECFRCGRICHIRADYRAKTHIKNLRPQGKVLEIARTKKQRPHKMCDWGPSIWGLLRYCQTTVMRWMVMNNPHMKPQK